MEVYCVGHFASKGSCLRDVEHSVEVARRLEDALISDVEEYLEHIMIRLKNDGINVETEIGEGHADDRIVNYAKNHALHGR